MNHKLPSLLSATLFSVGIYVITTPVPWVAKNENTLVFGNCGFGTMYVHSAELIGKEGTPVSMHLFGKHNPAKVYGKNMTLAIDRDGKYDGIRLKYSRFQTPFVAPFLQTRTLRL